MTHYQQHREFTVPLAGGPHLTLGPLPVVMGILNVTPDSFSDGGAYHGITAAVAHASDMLADGAGIIDIGGESTRPGAVEVTTQDELDRVIPVIEALRAEHIHAPISIDTYKALVADQAVQAGADIINDVYGLQREPEIADVAALYGTPMIAMHWDKDRDTDKDIIGELLRYFEKSVEIAERAGVSRDRIVLDPGFGFAKTLSENYTILRRLGELHGLGFPLLAGASRKSMIGKLLDAPAHDRLAGTLATTTIAYCAGAHIFRVHDVRPNRDALRVAAATLYGPPPTQV